ncbi:hypothetical protein PI124_g574 [Phytophthora idaei]|nr:hypothetical protein PI126_g12747 [Phytophthora idaei]KAG3254905.1 hypothetical protein PI124_g574 [Phytophthora idaei]
MDFYGENGPGSDTRRREGNRADQEEGRQGGVRAEVERLEERRRATAGSHPWFSRDNSDEYDGTPEEQEQSGNEDERPSQGH